MSGAVFEGGARVILVVSEGAWYDVCFAAGRGMLPYEIDESSR